MCKSISCPRCLHLTYHRGLCEHDDCKYNPLAAVLPPISIDKWMAIPQALDIQCDVIFSPFKIVRFYSKDESLVAYFAQEIGLENADDAMWNNVEDFFDLRIEKFGFDLVKLNAERAIAAVNHLAVL